MKNRSGQDEPAKPSTETNDQTKGKPAMITKKSPSPKNDRPQYRTPEEAQKQANTIRHNELTDLARAILHEFTPDEINTIDRYFARFESESAQIDYTAPVADGLPACPFRLSGYADKAIRNERKEREAIAPASESAKSDKEKYDSLSVKRRARKTNETAPAVMKQTREEIPATPHHDELPAPVDETNRLLSALLAKVDAVPTAESISAMIDARLDALTK